MTRLFHALARRAGLDLAQQWLEELAVRISNRADQATPAAKAEQVAS